MPLFAGLLVLPVRPVLPVVSVRPGLCLKRRLCNSIVKVPMIGCDSKLGRPTV